MPDSELQIFDNGEIIEVFVNNPRNPYRRGSHLVIHPAWLEELIDRLEKVSAARGELEAADDV